MRKNMKNIQKISILFFLASELFVFASQGEKGRTTPHRNSKSSRVLKRKVLSSGSTLEKKAFRPLNNDNIPYWPPSFVNFEGKKYKQKELLGEGSFGRVYAFQREGKEIEIALKVPLKKDLCTMNYFYPEIKSSQVLTKTIKNSLVEKYFTKLLFSAWGNGLYYLAFEYAPGLTLFERLENERGKNHLGLPVRDLLRISQQVLEALAYLCSEGFTHYDLKPDNIVDNGKLIKIVDYGFFQKNKRHHPPQDYFTARSYRSPEHVFACSNQNKHDLWSFGVVLYELCLDRELFRNTENELVLVSSWISILGHLPLEYKKKKRISCLLERLSLKAEEKRIACTKNKILEFFLNSEEDYKEKLNDYMGKSIGSNQKTFFRDTVSWDEELVERSNINPEIYEDFNSSERLFDLIWALLQYLPEKRISASEALSSFFSGPVSEGPVVLASVVVSEE